MEGRKRDTKLYNTFTMRASKEFVYTHLYMHMPVALFCNIELVFFIICWQIFRVMENVCELAVLGSNALHAARETQLV